mmetsp:Transcript_16019/g.33875  ORF Transcript_16019/g.33875 Transcript_16019/m.33875 type:complete len:243 (-) Transcript_16019:10-738(-)
MAEANSTLNLHSNPLPTDPAWSSFQISFSLALSPRSLSRARPNAGSSFVSKQPFAVPRRVAPLLLLHRHRRLHPRIRFRRSRNRICPPPRPGPRPTFETSPRHRTLRRRCHHPLTPTMTRLPRLFVAFAMPCRRSHRQPRTKWNETKRIHRLLEPCLPVMPYACPPSNGESVRGRRLSLLSLWRLARAWLVLLGESKEDCIFKIKFRIGMRAARSRQLLSFMLCDDQFVGNHPKLGLSSGKD